jgi:aryl-alcohol dehydrogenase-like predicted oxidoreductase
MYLRELGRSGLHVSPLCLGTNVFGWTIDEPMAQRILDAFIDSGFNFVDTADVYSVWAPGHKGGESETIIGNWVKRTGRRDRLIIGTKVGMEMAPERKGLSKGHILRSAEDSLKRLHTEYIDLYQAHIDDPDTPLEETLEAFAQLIRQGKVRAIGASNYPANRLKAALKVSEERRLPRYESLQPLYNLSDRAAYESELEPICRQHGLGVIPYFSLAAGFLTGKYRSEEDASKSPRGTRAIKYLDERGRRIMAALDRVSGEYNTTPGKAAIAWLLSRPTITAPIASATNLQQLDELIDAVNLKLPQSALDLLTQAGA